MRHYVLSILGLFIFILSAGVAFAESGSSTDFGLTMQQNGHEGTSSSYYLCAQIRPAGVGSSSDYVVQPYLPCDQVVTSLCGNGTIDAGEQCDSVNLGGSSCASLGYNTGTLSCSASCAYTGCSTSVTGGGGGAGGIIVTPPTHYVPPEEPPLCGNGILEANEQCDDGNIDEADGCNSACGIEKPIEEYIPAEVVLKPVPKPTYRPPQPDFIFITNDVTPMLFGKFIESDDYTVVFRDKDKYTAVAINTLGDFLSFESERTLEDGIYDVFVTDNRDPLYSAYIEIEVDKNELIPVPYIEVMGQYVFEDQNFENRILVFENRQPVLRGRTEKPALIGIYSVNDKTVTVIETDANNEFVFVPPNLLGFGRGEYRIVALYEDRLSSEVRIRFDVPFVCGPCRILGADLPEWVCILLLILAVLGVVMTALYSCCKRRVREAQRKSSRSSSARKGLLGLFVALLSLTITTQGTALAVDTTPSFFVYNGVLKDSSGNPIIAAANFRFSLWTSDDFNSGTDLAGGNINAGAANYAGWQETQTVTPNSIGYFEAKVGTTSTDPWPNFNNTQHPYLQVEIQSAGVYQLIDPDGTDNTDDRHDIGSEPFARNSDYLG